jgi:cyclohexanecarboxylate-CoA ligase
MSSLAPYLTEERAREWRARGWWRDQTFLDDLRRAAERSPDKPAFVMHHDTGVTTLTWAETARLSDRFAGALLDLGVGRGDFVALQLPNWWMIPPLVLACMRLGAVVCPLIPAYRRREVRFVLERTGARVCIVPAEAEGFDYAGMLAEIAADLPSLRHQVVVGPPRPGAVSFQEHFLERRWEEEHPAAELDRYAPGPDDLALLLFTSGTTGEPKGVLHSYNTLYGVARAPVVPFRLGPDDVLVSPLFLTHMAAFTYTLLTPLVLGATAVHHYPWNAGRLLDLVGQHRATFLYVAPQQLVEVLAAQRGQPRDVGGSLRHTVTGSAPVRPQLIDEVQELLGVRLYALWGMTENGSVTITRPEDPVDWAAHSDGYPVPWMEVRIDAGGSADGIGRLLVRGASQCLGYYKRDELYASLVDGEGWFDTGDLARPDSRGGIRIAGRAVDLIIRGSYKIPVLEVEAILQHHPQVREVALVGYTDPALGERACAVVVPDGDPPTLAALRERLRAEGVSQYFWPEGIEVVDALPKTPIGKVQKHFLRERLAAREQS